VKRKRTSVAWTEREDTVLCRLRNQGWDFERIAEKLPDRTLVAVQRRVAHLLARGRIESFRAPWSAEQHDLLCELRAQGLSAGAMTEHFKDRTRDAIAHQLRHLQRLGRIENRRSPGRVPWTVREESVLLRMRADGATLGDIAAKLRRRSRAAVANKAHFLIDVEELPRAAYAPHSKRPWSREEDDLVAVMRQAREPAKAMAVALNRSVTSVVSRIAERVRKGELELVRTTTERGTPQVRREQR
jgi:hypothetical protein